MITTKSEAITAKVKASPDFEKFQALAKQRVSVPKTNIQEREKATQQKKEVKKS